MTDLRSCPVGRISSLKVSSPLALCKNGPELIEPSFFLLVSILRLVREDDHQGISQLTAQYLAVARLHPPVGDCLAVARLHPPMVECHSGAGLQY
jgi:hypothetical protein